MSVDLSSDPNHKNTSSLTTLQGEFQEVEWCNLYDSRLNLSLIFELGSCHRLCDGCKNKSVRLVEMTEDVHVTWEYVVNNDEVYEVGHGVIRKVRDSDASD